MSPYKLWIMFMRFNKHRFHIVSLIPKWMIKTAVSDLTVGDSWILLYYIEHTLDTVSSK